MSKGEASIVKPITKPKVPLWLLCFVIMLAPFMEILDTSIANVSLPHIAGSFSATSSEILWVITSYLVANGIVIPSTAWFSSFFGRKKFLISCVIIFTLASALCGAANSIEMIVIARIIQGAGGGALQPISQAILLENFPPDKRGAGMAIYGIGVIFAPIIGPLLGGWITDNYSWRWIFYINVPVGILAVTLIYLFISDPSYAKKSVPKKIDFVGFGALVLWLATLQIVLDKGQEADWFSSDWICWLSAISAISMIFFIAWEAYFKDSIIDLKVYLDRNFSIGSFLMMLLGAILYGTLAILPLFLQNLMGYPAFNSGMAIAPRGIGSICAMGIAGVLSDRIDPRILITFGFTMLAISNFCFANINFQISPINIIIPNIMNGIGMSFIFIPLTALAFTTLKKEQMSNATGLSNLMRNIGGGIGTSIVSTMLSRNAQTHQSYMVAHLNPCNPVYQQKMLMFKNFFGMHMNTVVAAHKANGFIYSTLIKQATLWSYIDNFKMYGILCLLTLPLLFLFKKVKIDKKNPDEVSVH